MPILVAASVLALILLVARAAHAPGSLGPGSKSSLNEKLLAEVLALLPTKETVLRPGDARIDPVYGGRKPDFLGGPAWEYIATWIRQNADGTKISGGTSCGVTLAYWLGKAGWPADMVNRKSDDAWAPGGGFVPGAHISRFVAGAKKRGWYLAAPVDFQSGDAYHIDHPEKPNSDHVGAIVKVGEKRADGTRIVETGDGGQGTGRDVHRNERVLSADGKTLTLAGVPARVLGAVRAAPVAVA